MKLVKNLGYYLETITIQEIIDFCISKGENDPNKMIFEVHREGDHDENPSYRIYKLDKDENKEKI